MASSESESREVGPDPAAVVGLLRQWLQLSLKSEAMQWLNAEIDRARSKIDERRLPMTLGLVGRKVGRTDLALDTSHVEVARRLRRDWQPEIWSTDEAARVAILTATHQGDDGPFAARVDRLCTTAEITEHIAILKGFAVFPAPKLLYERAREGVRSSIQPVFEALACRNPYPSDYFDEAAWNQMVVKCVFVGVPIGTIVGLHQRRNPELVQMLGDLVAERRAASRPVPEAILEYIAIAR